MKEQWFWLSIGSLFLAFVFAYFRPKLPIAYKVFDKFKNITLTYFHSFCWALISFFCFIHYTEMEFLYSISNILLALGVVLYFVFAVMMLIHRFGKKR